MRRAAVYARKSSDSEAGVERQVEIARDFIATQEWLPGPVFTDNAISGATYDRPGLNALLAAMVTKPRPFDVLVMMNVDRLSRGTIAETLELQQRILTTGVEVWFYQTGQRVTLTTATDELKGAIDAYGARDFRDQIKAKTTASLYKKHDQGHATGARTFGYALVRKDNHTERVIDETQAAIVVRIFEMSASGVGDRRIANELNSEHAPAPGPKGWSKDGIRRALDNETYIGRVRYGMRVKKVKITELPALRIVSDALWQRVHSRKATTKQHYLRNEQGQLLAKPEAGLVSRYALSGIARCHVCGGGLKVFHGAKDIPRYRCAERGRRGTAVCANNRGIPVEELDEAVRLAVHELLTQDPSAVAALLEERDQRLRAEQAGQGDVRAAALAKAADLEKEIDNLVNLAASGKAPARVLDGIREREIQVAELKATPEAPKPFDRAKFFRMFAGARAIDMLVNPCFPQQIRACMRKLDIDKVIPYPNPDGKGWSFENTADLAGLLPMGAPEERAG